MKFLDSTLVVRDSIVRPKDSVKENLVVNNSIKFKESNNYKNTILKTDTLKKTFTKDSSSTYFFEPWGNILSVKNTTFNQNLKDERIFSDKNTQLINKENDKSIIHVNDLLFPGSSFVLTAMLLALFLLSLAKVSYRKYMRQFMNAIVNYSEAIKLYEDRNIMIDRLFFVMNIIFMVSGGLFINFFVTVIEPSLTANYPYLSLFVSFSIILVLYFYKFIFAKILGFLLLKVQVFNEYLYSSFLYYKIIGIFLLPISFLLYIVSNEYKLGIMIFSIVVICLLLILSVFRATRIILQKDILLFYWILYLCTIEFLPAILLYKFLSSYS